MSRSKRARSSAELFSILDESRMSTCRFCQATLIPKYEANVPCCHRGNFILSKDQNPSMERDLAVIYEKSGFGRYSARLNNSLAPAVVTTSNFNTGPKIISRVKKDHVSALDMHGKTRAFVSVGSSNMHPSLQNVMRAGPLLLKPKDDDNLNMTIFENLRNDLRSFLLYSNPIFNKTHEGLLHPERFISLRLSGLEQETEICLLERNQSAMIWDVNESNRQSFLVPLKVLTTSTESLEYLNIPRRSGFRFTMTYPLAFTKGQIAYVFPKRVTEVEHEEEHLNELENVIRTEFINYSDSFIQELRTLIESSTQGWRDAASIINILKEKLEGATETETELIELIITLLPPYFGNDDLQVLKIIDSVFKNSDNNSYSLLREQLPRHLSSMLCPDVLHTLRTFSLSTDPSELRDMYYISILANRAKLHSAHTTLLLRPELMENTPLPDYCYDCLTNAAKLINDNRLYVTMKNWLLMGPWSEKIDDILQHLPNPIKDSWQYIETHREPTKGILKADGQPASPEDWGRAHIFQNPRLWTAGSLTQQFALDMYSLIEEEALNRIRFNRKLQEQLARTYKNVRFSWDQPHQERLVDPNSGRPRYYLPRTYPGTAADINEKTEDMAAIMRTHGRPTLFITATMNPKHPDLLAIIHSFSPNPAETEDQAFIIERVFHAQKSEIIKDIRNGNHFNLGKAEYLMWVVERQNRGLPHVHILARYPDPQPRTADVIDTIVSAELPTPSCENATSCNCAEHSLRERVKHLMTHQCRLGRCKKNGNDACKYHYRTQRPLIPETHFTDRGQVVYRRRHTTDSLIVPHNIELISKYNMHINVEIVSSTNFPGYLNEYFNKSPDVAILQGAKINNPNDFIALHEQLRVIPAGAALARLCGYESRSTDIACIRIPVTLENEQNLVATMDETGKVAPIQKQTLSPFLRYFARPSFFENFKLHEYFQWVQLDDERPTARSMQLPTQVQLDTEEKILVPRQSVTTLDINYWKDNGDEVAKKFLGTNTHTNTKYIKLRIKKCSARFQGVSPSNREKMALLLLARAHHVRCYDDYKQGYQTLYEAAVKEGLIAFEGEYAAALQELINNGKVPASLRYTYCMYMLNADEHFNGRKLFDEFQLAMACDLEDTTTPKDELGKHHLFAAQPLPAHGQAALLERLDQILMTHDKTCVGFGLPDRTKLVRGASNQSVLDKYIAGIDVDNERVQGLEHMKLLNKEQRTIAGIILNNVACFLKSHKTILPETLEEALSLVDPLPDMQQIQPLVIDAGAGRGKTFLLLTVMEILRACKLVVVATATTGLAATLYPEGSTAHRMFNLPLDADAPGPHMDRASPTGMLLKSCCLIILDEAFNLHRHFVEQIDSLLKTHVVCNSLEFGGIPFVAAGDVRQILPVVTSEDDYASVEACLTNSPLWNKFQHVSLSKSERCSDSGLMDWIDKVGTGQAPHLGKTRFAHHRVRIPSFVKTGSSVEAAQSSMLSDLTKGLETAHQGLREMILAPLNETVHLHNTRLLHQLPGPSETKLATHEQLHELGHGPHLSHELMEAYHESGVPDYRIEFKIGARVMVLRNLLIKPPVVNGTIGIITAINNHTIDIIIYPNRPGARLETMSIPRICFIVKTANGQFKRRQFPLRLAYAATINKAQGQTLDKLILDLSQSEVFAHGQLYAALSRVRKREDMVIITKNNRQDTANVVYQEVLPI